MSKYTEHYKFKHSIRQTKERPIGWINRQLRIFTQHYLDTLSDKSDVAYINRILEDYLVYLLSTELIEDIV